MSDPISAGVGAAVAGTFDLIGDRWNNAFNARQSKNSIAANAMMQVQAQQWAERMRNSAYQATMEDMRRAGLNPILAYSQGPTATPGASALSAPMARASPSGLGRTMAEGAQVFARNASAGATARAAEAQASLNQALERQADSTTRVNDATAGLRIAETASELRRPGYVDASTTAASAAAGASSAAAQASTQSAQEAMQRIKNTHRYGPPGSVYNPQAALGAAERLQSSIPREINRIIAPIVGGTARTVGEFWNRATQYRPPERQAPGTGNFNQRMREHRERQRQ